MRTDDLLELCLQALSSGRDIPPEIARYLARHPEQRAEIEELILIAQRATHIPAAELKPVSRKKMGENLAARMGVDPALLHQPTSMAEPADVQQEQPEHITTAHRARRKPMLAAGIGSLARLRYSTHAPGDELADVQIRTAFRDLTPEDIRRYIGVRGEDYLYYRVRFPRWQPVFAFLAAILRGFKLLEKLTNPSS
ncbi:MAG: hypothetical protein ABI670_03275 [Chloroflexota bacterium]